MIDSADSSEKTVPRYNYDPVTGSKYEKQHHIVTRSKTGPIIPARYGEFSGGERCPRCGQKTQTTDRKYCVYCGRYIENNKDTTLLDAIWYVRNGEASVYTPKEILRTDKNLESTFHIAEYNYQTTVERNKTLQTNASYILVAIGVLLSIEITRELDGVESSINLVAMISLIISAILTLYAIFAKTKICNTADIDDLLGIDEDKWYIEMISVYDYLTDEFRWYWKCRSILLIWSKRLLVIGLLMVMTLSAIRFVNLIM